MIMNIFETQYDSLCGTLTYHKTSVVTKANKNAENFPNSKRDSKLWFQRETGQDFVGLQLNFYVISC
jgi:hypothetical protein